ncbi:unnamed protein product [Protopolystoma xenopodis]|uniref:Uncharacterized protein n=1 Tax=Protopolystoma xenopodis TaxID=117903 RepID=A0A3S5CHL1_9PLAT|nr:unnamed protein product [Protopolystoma xenopodis]
MLASYRGLETASKQCKVSHNSADTNTLFRLECPDHTELMQKTPVQSLEVTFLHLNDNQAHSQTVPAVNEPEEVKDVISATNRPFISELDQSTEAIILASDESSRSEDKASLEPDSYPQSSDSKFDRDSAKPVQTGEFDPTEMYSPVSSEIEVKSRDHMASIRPRLAYLEKLRECWSEALSFSLKTKVQRPM